MDPGIDFLASHLGGKLLDAFVTTFRATVVERWSRRRAEEFLAAFVAHVAFLADKPVTPDLDSMLTHIVEDEVCSEVLFDAYRLVTLSRSRVLGPRIIALLSAELVFERRAANDAEEAMLAAAEALADEEFHAFRVFVRDRQQRGQDVDPEYDGLRVKWVDEEIDSFWGRTSSVSTAPLDLGYALGRWAGKLRSLGILRDDMQETQRHYYPGEKSHRLNEGVVREITWWVELPKPYLKLVELIERASAHPERATADVY